MIRAVNADGTFAVRFDDGDEDPNVQPRHVGLVGAPAAGLVTDAAVDAKYGGKGKWFPGTIHAVNADGTFAVWFDDGDQDPCVKPQHASLFHLSD